MSKSQSVEPLAHERKIFDYTNILDRLKKERTEGLWSDDEIAFLERKLSELKIHAFARLEPWERVLISRHSDRPKGLEVARAISDEFEELFGDRLFCDDPALIAAMVRIGGKKFICLAQEKGSDLPSRMHRNFGMMQPEGYRKALRFMKMAEKFNLPLLCIIDTPGAYAGLEAEERGQAWAIAENLRAMATLKTPIISIVLSEGCSGGALGIGLADTIGMLEHAYYSVISPEGCASILWKDTAKKEEAAKALRLTSENLLELNLIDEVIPEPMGGAHHDKEQLFSDVREFTLRWSKHLRKWGTEELLSRRYEKFRQMGRFEVQGN